MKFTAFGKSLSIFFFAILTLQALGQATPSCGTPDSLVDAYLKKYSLKTDLTKARVAASEKLEYRLALDISHNTYLQYNGNKKLITENAYRFIEEASAIFEREMNVKLTVVSILIWDHPEPFALVNDYDYFQNVNQYWLKNRTEPRDAVVSLSIRGGWFYGGYRMASSNFPNPYYPGTDVDLLAHELGHTLGSPHTHNCSWPGGPIDWCNNVENASESCQNMFNDFTNGSIMSYCRSILSFHPLCQNLIRDFAEGKVNPEFRLNRLTSPPPTPDLVRILETNLTNTPTFEWQTPVLTDHFNIQIAKDEAFTQIVEDEAVKQSFFQSYGHPEGQYFARVKATNPSGSSDWSAPLAFSVGNFSEHTAPPLLYNVSIDNDQIITGNFKQYAGIQSYQIQVSRTVDEERNISFDYTPDESPLQAFRVRVNNDFYGPFNVRLRVRSGNIWSQWSEPKNTLNPWDQTIWEATNLQNTSSTPILATRNIIQSAHTGVVQHIEIATDADFQEIVYQQNAPANQLHAPLTNRADFIPELSENTGYHLRTRIEWFPQRATNWRQYSLSTGMNDQRFVHLGNISPNMLSVNFRGALKNKFYAAGKNLYVFDLANGYYSTENLKDWTPFTVSSTAGKSPNYISSFGVSDSGTTYLFGGAGNQFVESDGKNFTYPSGYPQIFFHDFSKAVVTQDGLFFKTSNQGVGRLQNGSWTFYGYQTLFSTLALCVEKDRSGRVWAAMGDGRVYSFANEQWTPEGYLPQGAGIRGLAFDNNQTCYAYGDWGLSRLNNSRQWEVIDTFSPYAIQKVIFDKNGSMWLAAYRYIGIINQDFADYALIKYTAGKAAIYSDGLNFLKEPFDLEIFNDQFLILTNGGELHTFDESKIQRFMPKASYCAGAEIQVAITSNSTFSKDNTTSFQVRNTGTHTLTSSTVLSRNGNEFILRIPENLSAGTYVLRTITTHPELTSNESPAFHVYPPVQASVSVRQTDQYKTILSSKDSTGLTYQWLFNGMELPGGNGASFEAERSGEYSVVVTNQGGCKTTSPGIAVVTDRPSDVVLLQNAPNPVHSKTEITFYLPQDTNADLELFNLSGQKVGHLKNGAFQAGWHKAELDAAKLPGGVYVYRLTAGNVVKTIKMAK
jgi:hypothetical protein